MIRFRKQGKSQYFVSILLISLISLFCYVLRDFIDYRIVALLLLMALSVLAILFDIIPVLISALLSALILNIFFIDPILNYKINSAESTLLFFIYLSIALVNAVLTNRIRKQEKKIRNKEEKDNTIKMYNTLLNSLSHELRTPIATIIGAVDTLKENENHLSAAQKRDILSEMEIASLRLNRQVENLLNMSRLETGNFQLKRDWCDVNELIFLVIRKFTSLQQDQIHFNPDENLPLFKIDTGLTEQIIYNLLHNSLIYNTSDTPIYIIATSEKDLLTLVIEDEGKGFPEEEIENVFDKFYRLPHSKVGGSGLGLSIVKGFTEAHNGGVILLNKPAGGASFTLTIPAETSYLKNLKNE